MPIQDNSAPAADKNKQRKLIRKKIAEILKGNTDAGENVFPNSTVPVWHSELDDAPVILIFPRTESATKYAEAPKELERDLSIMIEIIAAGPEINESLKTPGEGEKTLEDILDDIAEQVENILDADDSLQGTCDEAILENTEFEFDGTGGSPIGSCRLTYGVTYFTMSPRTTANQNVDDDFKDNEVKFHIGDEDDTVEATDVVIQPT